MPAVQKRKANEMDAEKEEDFEKETIESTTATDQRSGFQLELKEEASIEFLVPAREKPVAKENLSLTLFSNGGSAAGSASKAAGNASLLRGKNQF